MSHNAETYNQYGDPVFTYHFNANTETIGTHNLLRVLQREIVMDGRLKNDPEYIIHKNFIGSTQSQYHAELTNRELAIHPTSDFYFHAQLDRDKILYLDVELTRMKSGVWRRDPLFPHFSDLVHIALNYFHTGGKDTLGIMGAWSPKHFTNNRNVNYDTFVDGLRNGLSMEQAALRTPTGRVASTLGYKHPVECPPPPGVARSGFDFVFHKHPQK